MGFYYAREKRCFDAEWEKRAKEYRADGFDDAGIAAMRNFDWKLFRQRRVYENREQAFPSEAIDDSDDKSRSTLLQKFPALTGSFDESEFVDRYAWVDEVTDPTLADKAWQNPAP